VQRRHHSFSRRIARNKNYNSNINISININGNIHGSTHPYRTEGKSPTASFVFSRLGGRGTGVFNESARRTSNTTSSAPTGTRGLCSRCKRPNVVCICHALPDVPIDCGTRILILQHPREAKKRKRTSTVPLIGLSIQNVEICVGTKFEEGSHPLLDEALGMAHSKGNNDTDSNNSHGHALLLYPSEGALPLQTYIETVMNTSNEPTPTKPTKNQTTSTNSSDETKMSNDILVVVDGTWAQTQSMVQNSDVMLRKLPRVMFDEKTNSLFDSLRQEPAPHCTSTLEAISRSIRLLGSSTNNNNHIKSTRGADALDQSLKAMVDGQLRFALDEDNARPRYYRKNDDENKIVSKREAGRTRKMVSRKLQTDLILPRAKTKEEIEFDRIRFVYIAHMG